MDHLECATRKESLSSRQVHRASFQIFLVTDRVTGVQAASTWDTSLIYARGCALCTEAKGVGVNVQLGPVAGPLGEISAGGRG